MLDPLICWSWRKGTSETSSAEDQAARWRVIVKECSAGGVVIIPLLWHIRSHRFLPRRSSPLVAAQPGFLIYHRAYRVIVAMTHQRLEWPKIPADLAAEMVDEAGFIKILETTNPGEMNHQLVETLEGFNTWDEVHLHGGLMLKGDVYSLGLGKELRSWFEQRKHSVTASTEHKRSLFSLFANNPSQATLKTGGKNIVAKIPFGMELEMHVVGEKSPRKIDWAKITKVSVSKPPAEWAKNV